MPEPENKNDEIKKKIGLRKRGPTVVETTRGRLHVRNVVIKDFETFSKILDKGDGATSVDYEQLGQLALLTLVSAAENTENGTMLNEEAFGDLSADDVLALVRAVAQACEIETHFGVDTPEALGKVLFDKWSKVRKQIADNTEAIQQSISSSFKSLSDTLKFDLGHKFAELSAVRQALSSTVAVAALGQTQQTRIATLGRISDTFRIPAARSNISFVQTPAIKALVPPKFEETAAGRTAARAASASEESAKQLREVAGLMGTMAEQMAALQHVFLSKVLPKWNTDLQESANATNTTLRQAESSLFWAKWALVASVVVSVLMTAWQIWLAREYKVESDKQQERAEQLMTKQLTAVQDLNKQIMKQSQQNREANPVARRDIVGQRGAGPSVRANR